MALKSYEELIKVDVRQYCEERDGFTYLNWAKCIELLRQNGATEVQLTYYADKGWGSSEVTGAQMTLTLTGSVKPGDVACDYILGDDVMYGLGEKRKTHLKLQKGKKVIIWPITLANITPAYGDANNINSLTVTIHGNGRPAIGTTA